MFWIDTLLSITLPFVAFGLVGAVMAAFMRRAISPETIERVRTKNPPLPPGHPEHPQATMRRHPWESPLDAEITRLKRKSWGL